MYNKKMNRLMIGQALLFGIIIVFFGIIVVNEKMPSLKVKNVTRDINNYYEEKYSTLDVRSGDLKYNEEDNSYSITYYDRDYNDLNFTIKSTNNKITDNYEENYVKGKNVIEKCEDLVLEKYNEVFKNTNYQNIKVDFKDLNQYSDAEVVDILEGNIYNTGLYSVSYYVKVDSLDDVYLSNLVNSFNSISTSNGLSTNNYSVTFDNNGIIKLVEGGNFNE